MQRDPNKPEFAADAYPAPEERAKLIRYLEDSQRELLSCFADVTDELWTWKPSPGRWCVGEIVQHIVLAEGLLFSMAQKALALEPDPDWEAKTADKTEVLERVMLDRSRKAMAPKPVNPVGLITTRNHAMAQFREVRARSIRFVEATRLPLKAHVTAGPFPPLDPLNAFQFLLYIPLHGLRHHRQIDELKDSDFRPAL